MTLDLTRRAGFPIRDESRFMNMVSQINHFREFYRVVEEMPVKIGSIVKTVSIWMMKKVNNELIFEIPYIHVTRITQKIDSDNLTILILLNNSKTIIRFLNALI